MSEKSIQNHSLSFEICHFNLCASYEALENFVYSLCLFTLTYYLAVKKENTPSKISKSVKQKVSKFAASLFDMLMALFEVRLGLASVPDHLKRKLFFLYSRPLQKKGKIFLFK